MFSVIFTINPIKQLRLLKSELSLEVSEMSEPNQQANQNRETEEHSANQNRYIADANSSTPTDS